MVVTQQGKACITTFTLSQLILSQGSNPGLITRLVDEVSDVKMVLQFSVSFDTSAFGFNLLIFLLSLNSLFQERYNNIRYVI